VGRGGEGDVHGDTCKESIKTKKMPFLTMTHGPIKIHGGCKNLQRVDAYTMMNGVQMLIS